MAAKISELNLLLKLEEVLRKKEIPSSYVQIDLDWLKKRREVWGRSSWRIGVVGITSSGKSTLINALCGEDILPKEARPTSGVLVSCKKGKKRKATIIKKSGEKEILTGKKLNKKIIKRYADEEKNPENKYMIDEICLEFPQFLIGNGIEIVDSPGLDAFGLEGHEEITLRQLIPSVDIVIYLTTTKANSDKRNLNILNKIASENKPVIIVQNFSDCIEAEYTTGGRIRRDKQEVAQRLKKRIEGILEEAGDEKFKNIPLIQVSALWGLQAMEEGNKKLWDKSNISRLIDSVSKSSNLLKEERYHNRINQIKNQVEVMQERFINDYKEYKGDKVSGKILKRLSEKKDQFNSFAQLEDRLFAKLDRLKDDTKSSLRNLIKRMRQTSNENKLNKIVNQIKGLTLEVQKNIFSSIDKLIKQENKLFKEFNLSIEDKRFSDLNLPSTSELKVYKKTETYQVKKKRKKKSGILGWRKAKRFLTGESDYETYYVDKTRKVVDARKTRREYKNYCDKFKNAIKKLINNWKKERVQARKVLKEELNRLEHIKTARNNKPENIDDLNSLISEIRNIKKRYFIEDRKQMSNDEQFKKKINKQNNKLDFKEDKIKAKITSKDYKLLSSLIDLASLKKRIYFEGFIHNIFRKISLNKNSSDTLIFLGYDREEIDKFFGRITGHKSNLSDSNNGIYNFKLPNKTIFKDFKKVLLIDANRKESLDYLKDSFILFFVDIHQYGLTQKKINDRNYTRVFNKAKSALVIQSIAEYNNEDNLGEAYLYYRKLCKFIGREKLDCLVNNDNPFYTALFFIANQFSWKAGIGEEQEAINYLSNKFSELITPKNLEKAGKFFKTISKSIK